MIVSVITNDCQDDCYGSAPKSSTNSASFDKPDTDTDTHPPTSPFGLFSLKDKCSTAPSYFEQTLEDESRAHDAPVAYGQPGGPDPLES